MNDETKIEEPQAETVVETPEEGTLPIPREGTQPEGSPTVMVKIGSLVEQLRIRIYPDPVLRTPCEEIEEITDWHKELAGRMAKIMRGGSEIPFGDQKLVIEPGIGLSAPQVGHSVQMLVFETGDAEKAAALLNPKIVWRSKKQVLMPEGCLSFPSFGAKVKRPAEVVLQAITLGGEGVEVKATGLEARVLQHEIDHLRGILFIDKISPARRSKLKSYLKKLKRIHDAHKAYLAVQETESSEES